MLVKYISREVSHWVSYWVSYWFRIGFVMVSHWRKLAWLSRAAAGPGRAGPGGRRAWPGGKVTTGEEPRGAEASGERHAPQRVATLSFELYSFFVF